MAQEMKPINVEQIMQEIKEDIQKRGYTDENVDFVNIAGDAKAVLGIKTDFSAYELECAIKNASDMHRIEYYRMIPKGGLKSFIQRSIRKMVKFMMIPMVDQQNQFNYQTIVCLRQFEAFAKEHDMQMEQKDRIIEGMEEKLYELNKRCEALESQLKDKEASR